MYREVVEVGRATPFHCTTESFVNPVPLTSMDVAPEPTIMLAGETALITGVIGGVVILRKETLAVPPPGAGLNTETGRLPTVA